MEIEINSQIIFQIIYSLHPNPKFKPSTYFTHVILEWIWKLGSMWPRRWGYVNMSIITVYPYSLPQEAGLLFRHIFAYVLLQGWQKRFMLVSGSLARVTLWCDTGGSTTCDSSCLRTTNSHTICHLNPLFLAQETHAKYIMWHICIMHIPSCIDCGS